VHNRGSNDTKCNCVVSDIDRSVRWYRNNVGIAEASKPDIVERHDNQVMVMTRNRAGVTLISFGGASRFSRDAQIMCFLLEGPPAPSPGSPPGGLESTAGLGRHSLGSRA
jgi:hypothetical protein